jgi:predicted MFS family arabinose efflux permease
VRHRLPPALKLRSFAFLWVSSLANGLALQMLVVAIGLQVYVIHHDPLDLGLVGLAEFVPLPLLVLPAGYIADRLPRRRVVAAGLAVQVGIALGLVAITLDGAHTLWPFLAIGATAGVASAVTNPAGRSLTPEIVGAELLPGAIALRSVANQAGIVVGPAIGGIVFKFSPTAVYVTAASLFALAVVTTLAITTPHATARPRTELNWESLSAGIGFIVRTKMLLGAISLDLVSVLLGDSIVLAPVFALSILHTGPIGVGLLRAAPSVGALTAGLLLARRQLPYRAGPTLLGVVAAFGAMMIVFGLSRSLPLSLAALAVSGFADMISMNIRATAVLLVTPPELQGRVGAVEWVFISASNELGAFESGAVASLVGTVAAVVAGGAVMIGVAGSWRRLFPSLARMGRLDELRLEPV